MQLKDFGFKYLGKLKNRKTLDIESSRLGIGFECLDRDMWDAEQAWPVLEDLGVKWARVQTGWAVTEKVAGKYDFAWLDEIVDKLLAKGVEPWLSFSYGNPVYTKSMNTGTEVSPNYQGCNEFGVGFPPIHTPEERAGWQNFVRATAKHFKGRVDHFEVWNEPDLLSFWKCGPKAESYVDLVRLTAGPLREEQPESKLIGGAIAWGMTVWSLKFLDDCMKAGMHELIDIITYHGYKSVPERHSTQEIAAFNHIVNKYNPSLKYWQGEAGVQSYVPEKAKGVGALSTMKFSESIQARMLLRRTLLELDNGASMSSYFHMADFAHYAAFKETFHYGIVRLEDGSPKPAYYALQSLATLLCDPMENANGRTACHMSVLDDTDDPRATKATTWHANFVRGDVPVHAWWFPESVEEDQDFKQVEMNYFMDDSLRLDNPVLIDPVSQEVYEVEFEMDKRTCAETWVDGDEGAEGIRYFKKLPISNSPLILTDRSAIEIKEV